MGDSMKRFAFFENYYSTYATLTKLMANEKGLAIWKKFFGKGLKYGDAKKADADAAKKADNKTEKAPEKDAKKADDGKDAKKTDDKKADAKDAKKRRLQKVEKKDDKKAPA